MAFVKNFQYLGKNDAAIAGGKGASLGEMTQAGIPVPPGFVVLASAFDQFVEKNQLGTKIEALLNKINLKNINSVNQASDKIRGLILKLEFPPEMKGEIQKEFLNLKAKYVAVRSSATAEDSSVASWAGELESYLNVDNKNLLTSVKKCWASLFTPRAISYRFEKKLRKTKVAVAVVVQKMINSEISGICFTAHPVTKDRGQIVIEAGYGLGEAIVGGIITPDTYIIDKKNFALKEKSISQQGKMIVKGPSGNMNKSVPASQQEKQKLGDKQIISLAKLCQKIEKHYGIPQDIEWAYEKNKMYIVQSRPITTL
ncbi:MAG: PEP/pyruvate-binding domain-containing protein [Patescibacteria group bacterium]